MVKDDLSESVLEFLFFSSIGSTKESKQVDCSINRAYRDFCRTMNYSKKYELHGLDWNGNTFFDKNYKVL